MKLILFDTNYRKRLYPLTLTRAVAGIRMGIFTGKERWEKLTGAKTFVLTEEYLQPLYERAPAGEYLVIDSHILPSLEVVENVLALKAGEALHDEHGMVAGKVKLDSPPTTEQIKQACAASTLVSTIKRLTAPWQIMQWNEEMLKFDFDLITKARSTQGLDDTSRAISSDNIFIEEGATISYSILNASTGSIYIGKNAVITEGCMIRGPVAICEGAVMKMGTKMYGATTVGPFCNVGGEIKNTVMLGCSNKAHDGYLGDSVIGEWCNLGAGSTVSNVKNTGGEVKVWDRSLQRFISAGNKCGVIMGDYSRAAINTSINTGTVIGVSANVFCSGLTPKLIHDFSWGCEGKVYDTGKAITDINNWKKFKGQAITDVEIAILKYIFEHNNIH